MLETQLFRLKAVALFAKGYHFTNLYIKSSWSSFLSNKCTLWAFCRSVMYSFNVKEFSKNPYQSSD